jgi:hypothetical protein
MPNTGTKTSREDPRLIEVLTQTIGHGRPRAFVDVPRVEIGHPPLSAVKWTNRTGDKVSFWFPNGDHVFKPPKHGFKNPISIDRGESLELKVQDKPESGTYHYHVYCEELHECAHGNSEPEIVV